MVLDVGAHIGFFSLACALRGAHVYAFEPAPGNASILREHVRMNDFHDRITVVAACIGDTEGTSEFFTNGETMSAALYRENIEELSPQQFLHPTEVLTVPMATLDGFCDEYDITSDLVKIDIEGAELAALRGATQLLTTDTRFLVEVHPDGLPYLGGSVTELEQLIADTGRDITQLGVTNQLGIYHIVF